MSATPLSHAIIDAASARIRELEAKLRDEEERHAALQARCYEGFPSATDGIFDALREADEAAPRWIPVEERLPTEEGRYAIVYRYKTTNIRKQFIADWWSGSWCNSGLQDTAITHWMPLPDVPHQDSGRG